MPAEYSLSRIPSSAAALSTVPVTGTKSMRGTGRDSACCAKASQLAGVRVPETMTP